MVRIFRRTTRRNSCTRWIGSHAATRTLAARYLEALQIQKWTHRAAAGKGGAANAQQRLLLEMQARFEQLEERERQREYRERQREQREWQWQQQNMQMSQMLQQYLTTFHPSGGASPPRPTATTLVTPAAAAAAATIRHESPLPTEIIAATAPPPHPPPPPPLQQQVAATADVGPVGVDEQTLVNPYADLAELPVPIFSTRNNALPATFSALLDEYQLHGHWRYKNIKGRKMQWNHGEKFALSKRQYLYDAIEREVQAMGSHNDSPYRNKTLLERLNAAAIALEHKYKDKSLDQAMREMKAVDHTVRPRKKRRNAEVSADTTAPMAVAP
jgi:hypothetical protein